MSNHAVYKYVDLFKRMGSFSATESLSLSESDDFYKKVCIRDFATIDSMIVEEANKISNPTRRSSLLSLSSLDLNLELSSKLPNPPLPTEECSIWRENKHNMDPTREKTLFWSLCVRSVPCLPAHCCKKASAYYGVRIFNFFPAICYEDRETTYKNFPIMCRTKSCKTMLCRKCSKLKALREKQCPYCTFEEWKAKVFPTRAFCKFLGGILEGVWEYWEKEEMAIFFIPALIRGCNVSCMTHACERADVPAEPRNTHTYTKKTYTNILFGAKNQKIVKKKKFFWCVYVCSTVISR